MENYTCVLVTPFPSCFSETFEKPLPIRVKVCIIRLDHICFEKSSSIFWQVRCWAHRPRTMLLSKVRRRFFFKFCGLLWKPNLYYLVKWILLHGMLLWRQLGTFPLLQWHFWSMVTQSIFVAQFMTTRVWSSKIIMCEVKQ